MDATTSPFEMLIEYLAERATPEEILAFQLPEDLQERAEVLLDKNNAGTLSAVERFELDRMMHFERVMSRLKARAYRDLPK